MQISKAQLVKEELYSKFLDLYDEHRNLDDLIKEATADRDNLKEEIKMLVADLQPTDVRVEILLEDEGKKGWDRQVKHTGGGLDLGLLEAALGSLKYETLLCNEVITWEFRQDRLDLAITRGQVTEAMLKECTIKPKLIPSLTRR